MDGFKNTTKMQMGHTFSKSAPCPDYASGSRTVFHKANGGIIAGGGMPGVRMNNMATRPVLPRPHVMPQGNAAMMKPMARLAKGGKYDGGGGPYNADSPPGNALDHSNRPYSEIEKLHPKTPLLRPGYAKGGSPKIKKGALHKDMGIPQGQKIPVSKIRSKLAKDKAHGNKKGVKRDVFALNAKTKFADGGAVGCDEPAVRKIADQEVGKHVASKPPQGHGVKPRGGLAFMREPLCGGGKV